MRIARLSIYIVLFCIVVPVFSGWEDWEEDATKTVLGCDKVFYKNIGTPENPNWVKIVRLFTASADYTAFSDPEYPNVPIIPERFNDPGVGLTYRVNRVFFNDEGGKSDVDFKDVTGLGGKPLPLLATCSYIDGETGTEYCAGLLIRCAAIGGGEWEITYHPVDISTDPEVEMAWLDGVGEMSPGGGDYSMIQSGDMVGDDSGNIHLVTAESPWDNVGTDRTADWTTDLYYRRWNIDIVNGVTTMNWDTEWVQLTAGSLKINRNPDIACDSEGNVHIVYSFNDDAGTSDFGIGYIKITFDIYGEISTVNQSVIAPDGTGVMNESPDITLDDDDNPHVVYQHDGGLSNNWNVYYTTKQGPFGWLMPEQVPAPAGSYYCWEPSIAISRGYIHVVYSCGLPAPVLPTVYTTTNDRIYYTRKTLTSPFETPDEISLARDYSGDYAWGTEIFKPDGYANWNHYPSVIAGDDEISVVWVGHNSGYLGPAALLARRCRWVEE